MILMFALFCVPWVTNAQTTVEIGDGTSAAYYAPIGTYYNYSITEQLYTSEEIGMAGTISSISFNYALTDPKDFNVTVYMANVDAADLSSAGISLAEAEQVFQGTVSVSGTGWVTIELDSPFAYDGQSNLLIGFNKTGGATWFSGNSWYYTTTSTPMVRYSQTDGSAYDLTTVPVSTTTSRPNIQMVITPSGTVCERPIAVTVDNITPTSCEVSIEYTGVGTSQNLRYKASSDADWTIVEGLSAMASFYQLSSLTSNTTYSVGVQTVCENGATSGWTSASFTTPAGIPLIESFGTSIPTGWTQYTGLMSGVLAGSTELTSASYAWSFGENAGVFDNHAFVNIYGTSCIKWLVLPAVAMENNVQLLFDVAYTAYTYGSETEAPGLDGTDDKFVVLINDGQNWSVLRQWDNAGSQYVLNDLNSTPATVAIDLSSYAGQNIAIAFYCESTVQNADNNIHIDNVSINYIPDCAVPTSFVVSNVAGHTADLTGESVASSFQICVNNDENNLINVNTNTYTLTGLAAETNYSVKVRANCGSAMSDWTSQKTFTTTVACPAPANFTCTGFTANTATLSWSEGVANEWQILLNNDSANLITVTETPYTLTNLTAETVYTASVRALCGEDGESEWSSSISFEPTAKLVIGSGTSTNSYLPTYTYYNYSLTQQIYTVEELGDAGVYPGLGAF